MGFFDFFKKKKSKPDTEEKVEQPQDKAYDIQYNYTLEGLLEVYFKDSEPAFSQDYDNTKLIVNPKGLGLTNEDIDVYDCAVLWYQDDTCYAPPDSEPRAVLRGKERVLAQIDLQLAALDPEYCYKVMKELLSRKRVTKHIEDGLQENPEKPCGNYVGGVKQNDDGDYEIFFSDDVGEAIHNSSQMVNCREEHKKQMQKKAYLANQNRQHVQDTR